MKWTTDVSWHTCFQAMLWQFRNSKAATKYQLLVQCWKRICDIKILKQVECFQICSQKAACVCHYLNNNIFLFVLAGQVYAPLHNSVMFTLYHTLLFLNLTLCTSTLLDMTPTSRIPAVCHCLYNWHCSRSLDYCMHVIGYC